MLQAADISFAYQDTPVLTGVSLDVPNGSFTGIIGPNGSGKTTLLRMLAGTRRPDRGRVALDGQALTSLPRAVLARRMAVVPQETQLAFDYTVLEVVLMGRYPHLGPFAIEGPADVEIARRALASTGTLVLQDRAFSTLSGGEKQRVVIASALAQIEGDRGGSGVVQGIGLPAKAGRHDAGRHDVGTPGTRTDGAVLLLDEPTAALDLKYQLEIAALLRSLHWTHALTVVLSTHDLNFAAALCDSLVMLKEGRVLAAGRVADVLTRDRVRQLYDVDADIGVHPSTGQLTVVPLRAGGGGRV